MRSMQYLSRNSDLHNFRQKSKEDNYIVHLMSVPALAKLTKAELQQVSDECEVEIFRHGETSVSEGDLKC